MLVVHAGRGVHAHDLLRAVVAQFCQVEPDGVRVGSSCPRCGSPDHGRPVALLRSSRPAPQVSLSRAGPLVLVAVTDAGPVGVDVEADRAAGFARFDQVALHPAERADDDAARTRTWVRKEALLKATGDGLRVDPRQVRLSKPTEPPAVLEWPGRLQPTWLYDLDPAPGFTAAAAVLAAAPPQLVVHPAL